MQPQLLERLGDLIEAGGVERLNDDRRLCQLSLHHDDEVQVPEAHVCTQYPADVVTSHSRPGVDVETRKSPYLARQLSVFQVNTNE